MSKKLVYFRFEISLCRCPFSQKVPFFLGAPYPHFGSRSAASAPGPAQQAFLDFSPRIFVTTILSW